MTAELETADHSDPTLSLVLYDGVCGLCHWLMSFLHRHDRRNRLRFAPLQSDLGHALLQKHGLNPAAPDTVVVLENFGLPTERALTRSPAVLRAVHNLGGLWILADILKVLPQSVRERIYNFIARRRYRLFGKSECTSDRKLASSTNT